jgi:hypothetical protein
LDHRGRELRVLHQKEVDLLPTGGEVASANILFRLQNGKSHLRGYTRANDDLRNAKDMCPKTIIV